MKLSKNNLKKRMYDVGVFFKNTSGNLYSKRSLLFEKVVRSNLYSKRGILIEKVVANKRKFLIVAIAAAVVITGGVSSYLFWGGKGGGKNPSAFSLIKKGELVGSAVGLGQTVWIGNLKVTLHQSVEESYRPLELDELGRRVTKTYFGIDLEVYNTDLNVTDFLVYGLTDDLGNEYERDFEVEFYLDDKKDLGKADNYISQTLRRGYLFFPPINEKAKKLELAVYSKVQDKKIVFEIER